MESDKLLGSNERAESGAEVREWIIQRCTERWIGTELQYEDFPGYMRDGQWTRIVADRRHPGRETPSSTQDLMTRDEMMLALEYCEKHYPENFKGHNIMNCRCASHAALRESTSTARSHTDTGATLQPNDKEDA